AASSSLRLLKPHVEAQRLGSLHVDHEVELGWLHHWQVGRFLALEYPSGVDTGLTIAARTADRVGRHRQGGSLGAVWNGPAPCGRCLGGGNPRLREGNGLFTRTYLKIADWCRSAISAE